ncbi:PhnB protein [Aeromicrobium sp. SORGH_AS981]|uniref:VOC family protein n=1 Tax=Aeromicrobium sp. SORGH_AS_0981 TaxID=3041802 RepID=UPI00285B49D6|nr:VOC family protein [Aeromicrobium sp. SORGH_AS_0981]MDR6119730.1 PhnB protein [Aeromicrobium sp. SORGH_AS_0981]
MTIRLNPYLNFRDQSRAALEFYHSVLGGELTIATFGDYGMSDDPSRADLVMHGHLVSDAGLDIMASDTPPGGDDPAMGTAINIALTGDDERLRDYFTGLSEGAEVVVPLAPAPWGDEFGLLNDTFGVAWLFNVATS